MEVDVLQVMLEENERHSLDKPAEKMQWTYLHLGSYSGLSKFLSDGNRANVYVLDGIFLTKEESDGEPEFLADIATTTIKEKNISARILWYANTTHQQRAREMGVEFFTKGYDSPEKVAQRISAILHNSKRSEINNSPLHKAFAVRKDSGIYSQQSLL